MGAVILRILASILPGWLSSNLMIIGIAAATVLVTNAVSGVVWYVKGHNSAAAQCHVATLIRERDELRRDLGVQKLTAEQASQLANELSEREAAREQKGAEDAAAIKHVDGCVVPNRVRSSRPKR
jgi:uncharacterized membrane protein